MLHSAASRAIGPTARLLRIPISVRCYAKSYRHDHPKTAYEGRPRSSEYEGRSDSRPAFEGRPRNADSRPYEGRSRSDSRTPYEGRSSRPAYEGRPRSNAPGESNPTYDGRPRSSGYEGRSDSREGRPRPDSRTPYEGRQRPSDSRSINQGRPRSDGYGGRPQSNSTYEGRPRPSGRPESSSYGYGQRPARKEDPGVWNPPARKKKPTSLADTVVPQLSRPELRSLFSQELFVFRCDLNATQVAAAMTSYPQLREVNVLTPDDVSNLCRQLHTRYRLDRTKPEILPHIKTLIADLRAGTTPGHPLASVHILSCLKEMEEFTTANEFWAWLIDQSEDHTDARVYGAAIESLAYQGEQLSVMEDMYTEALSRYSASVVPAVARDTGKGTRLMLFQGIITARLLHGDWAAAYEGFDTCIRLYPTLTPSRLYELIIYERPVKEAYIVFLMACRAGSPPKPLVLTPLLKQLYAATCDIPAMIRVLYAFVGAGGKPSFQHLNSLISALLSSLSSNPHPSASSQTMSYIRTLISAFARSGVPPTLSTFNTIITHGGLLNRPDLIQAGLKELARARLEPNAVTYRIILNAFGQLRDATAVRSAWADLIAAKKDPWDIKDLRALVRACIRTTQSDFCRSELKRMQYAIGNTLYHTASDSIAKETARIHRADRNPVIPALPLPEGLEKDVDALARVFSAHQVHDFAAEPVLGIESGPTPVGLPESEMQRCYDALTGGRAEGGEEAESRTKTGYTIRALRFENWKSVNRLLYEAELHERETEARAVERMRKRAKGDVVEDLEEEGREEVKRLFAGEERAKERIEEVRRGLEGAKVEREGGEGRREELRVRARMVGEVGGVLSGGGGMRDVV